LRISVKHPRGYELVEDTDNERWKDSEDDIVEGKSPGLVGNHARETVEEGELQTGLAIIQVQPNQTHPELRHIQDNILVEGICKAGKTTKEAIRADATNRE
jgi:hypothetical protein